MGVTITETRLKHSNAQIASASDAPPTVAVGARVSRRDVDNGILRLCDQYSRGHRFKASQQGDARSAGPQGHLAALPLPARLELTSLHRLG